MEKLKIDRPNTLMYALKEANRLHRVKLAFLPILFVFFQKTTNLFVARKKNTSYQKNIIKTYISRKMLFTCSTRQNTYTLIHWYVVYFQIMCTGIFWCIYGNFPFTSLLICCYRFSLNINLGSYVLHHLAIIRSMCIPLNTAERCFLTPIRPRV